MVVVVSFFLFLSGVFLQVKNQELGNRELTRQRKGDKSHGGFVFSLRSFTSSPPPKKTETPCVRAFPLLCFALLCFALLLWRKNKKEKKEGGLCMSNVRI